MWNGGVKCGEIISSDVFAGFSSIELAIAVCTSLELFMIHIGLMPLYVWHRLHIIRCCFSTSFKHLVRIAERGLVEQQLEAAKYIVVCCKGFDAFSESSKKERKFSGISLDSKFLFMYL